MNFKANSKKDIVDEILKEIASNPAKAPLANAKAYAPANFALIKYWGKENESLMVPNTGSLSISLGEHYGTTTKISLETTEDIFILNDKEYNKDSKEFKKLFNFIDLFRDEKTPFKIVIKNDLNTASGLATSASGFASIVLTLNELYQWNLSKEKLSILARLGSVSASRSVYKDGFVELIKDEIGAYSNSKQLDYKWKGLCIGILEFNNKEKKISSTSGMKETVENSILYKYGWNKQVQHDLENIHKSLKNKDWELFQRTVQANALAMHATAISAGVIYWSQDTLQIIKKIIELQAEDVNICFTEDAGEHIKLFSDNKSIIEKYFPQAQIIEFFK